MYSCIYVHVDNHNLGSSLKTISRQHGYSHNNNNEKQDIQPRYDLKFCLLRLRADSSRSMMVIASASMQLLVSLRPTALTSSKPSTVKRAILISSFLNPSLKLACSRASSRQFVHQDFALDDEETASWSNHAACCLRQGLASSNLTTAVPRTRVIQVPWDTMLFCCPPPGVMFWLELAWVCASSPRDNGQQRNMPEICQNYARNMPVIYQKYARNIPDIC